jgi:hypothetical protein
LEWVLALEWVGVAGQRTFHPLSLCPYLPQSYRMELP